jgi:hypothetical protein
MRFISNVVVSVSTPCTKEEFMLKEDKSSERYE